MGGRKCTSIQSDRVKEIGQGFADRGVIIDDDDSAVVDERRASLRHGVLSLSLGRVKQKVAPHGFVGTAHMYPP